MTVTRGRTQAGGDRHRWQTPPSVYQPIDDAFGFDMDLCADANTARHERWTPDVFGQVEPFTCGWMNPPYGAPGRPRGFPGTGRFVERCAELAQTHGATTVALVPASTDAAWWRRAQAAAALTLLLRRVAFLRPDGSPATAPPMGVSVFVFRPVPSWHGIRLWHPPEPLPAIVGELAPGRR